MIIKTNNISLGNRENKELKDFKPNGHLSGLFQKWSLNKKEHDQEMAETINKLCTVVLVKTKKSSAALRNHEDMEDLRAKLVAYTFTNILPNIKRYDNKSIYNYIFWSLQLYLTKKKKTTVIRNLKEKANGCSTWNSSNTSITSQILDNFGSTATNEIAILLSEGFTRMEIMKKLSINKKTLDEHIEIIRQNILETNKELI